MAKTKTKTAIKKSNVPDILYVQICEAKPNKMFTKEMTDAIRFLRYNHKVECAACGKARKIMWTMLVQFKAADMALSQFALRFHDKSFPPLTPVCDDHPMAPHYPGEPLNPPGAVELAK